MVRTSFRLLAVLALALLLLFAAPVLAEELKGTITSVSTEANEFVLTDLEGTEWTFQMAEDARVFLGEEEAQLFDLEEGIEVTVIYEPMEDIFIAKEVRGE